MRFKSAFSFRKRRRALPGDEVEDTPVSSANVDMDGVGKTEFGIAPSNSKFQEATVQFVMEDDMEKSLGRLVCPSGRPVNEHEQVDSAGASKTSTRRADEDHILADMPVPPLMTGSQLHVNGSYSSRGTLTESEHAKVNQCCAAQRASDSRDGYFHAGSINGQFVGAAKGGPRHQIQTTPEEMASENARLRTELQRMVHDLEALRCQSEKPEGPQSQSSARQYAEDLEIQLEHVECLKGDLELELAKAQAEITQLKRCIQETANKDSSLELQELQAALESSRSTQSTLERQVQDLRNALKATGTPTECVTVGQRRLTADDVRLEMRKKDKEVDELHGQVSTGTSELAQAKMELEWAKDSQRRAEDTLARKRTRKVNGENYTLEEACRELERITKENQILKATNEAYSAAEKSENDVWQIALKDMSAQLQVTASERAACQAALLKLQDTLTEHTKRHAEETKALHERIEATEAERTCIELELTNVKAERDDLIQKASVQAFQGEVVSSQQLHIPIASVSDYDLSNVSQKLKAAQKEGSLQVEILKTQLANEQVARDLVTQQFRAASSDKCKLQKQVSIQEKKIINLKSDIDEQTVQLIGALKDKDRLYSATKVEHTDSEPDHQSALKLPPTRPWLSSPDVAALLTPFHDRLLAFEAKHCNDGTVPSSPTRASNNDPRGTAAEALIRALHASRNAYAANMQADAEGSPAISEDGRISAPPSPSRPGSVSGRSGASGIESLKLSARVAPSRQHSSRAASGRHVRRSDSEELDRLMDEVKRESTVVAAKSAAGGSVLLVQEQLGKLKDDLDACLGDRQDDKEDIHSARSSSTGVLSEAPLLRHAKARKKAQQEAEMHKKMISTLEGLIQTIVSLHGADKNQEGIKDQSVPHVAKGASKSHRASGDVFDMLSNALSSRHDADRASIAPSHASSTAGPFKVNSMKLIHAEPPAVDEVIVREQHQRRMPKATSYNARAGQVHAAMPLPKSISLPNDHGLHGPGGGRQGRFTLEGVKEEQPSSFQSSYPPNDATPASAPTATPPTADSAAPRRWSLLRMFTMQKKEATPVPRAAQDGASEPGAVPRSTTGAAQDTVQRGQHDMGGARSIKPRLASTMPRHAPHKDHDDGRRPSYGPRDAMPSSQFGIHARGGPIPSAHPGTASSTGTNWQTPQAELHTPSAYITPLPLNPSRRVPAGRSREMLQAAQQATPEQARAMLQKFGSIRAQQRRNSQVTGY